MADNAAAERLLCAGGKSFGVSKGDDGGRANTTLEAPTWDLVPIFVFCIQQYTK